jgi:hypothetical protein
VTEPWSGDPTQPAGGMADRTRAMPPPSRQPPGRGGYDDGGARRRRIWAIVAGVVAGVIIVVLVILLLTSSSGNNDTVSISSFNVPSTVTCSGPTTIGVSWTTSNANEVILSIDGPAPYKTYPGSSGADTVPFACNGAPHTYTLTARRTGGGQATQTQTVTPLTAPTTRPAPTTPPPTKPPPTTTPPPSTTTTS